MNTTSQSWIDMMDRYGFTEEQKARVLENAEKAYQKLNKQMEEERLKKAANKGL